jgi:hypothetical protein
MQSHPGTLPRVGHVAVGGAMLLMAGGALFIWVRFDCCFTSFFFWKTGYLCKLS